MESGVSEEYKMVKIYWLMQRCETGMRYATVVTLPAFHVNQKRAVGDCYHNNGGQEIVDGQLL